MTKTKNVKRNQNEQSGAALPTVLLITFLIVTATAAMLSAAGANARNATDLLSETKAYYSAESGIQAAVNVLRNQSVNYKDAVNNDGGTLVNWRPHNWTSPEGITGWSVGEDPANGYRVVVSDPDNSQSQIGFSTDITGIHSGFSKTGTSFTSTVEYITDTDNKTIISWTPNPSATPIPFDGAEFVTENLGSFTVTNVGNGSPINTVVHFRLNLRLAAPDNPTWVIKGTISSESASPQRDIKFVSYAYRMVGSDIWLCSTSSTCPATAPASFTKTLGLPGIPDASATTTLGVRLTPKEPQRLLIKSRGWGPYGARKELEAVISKTFFPAVPPAAGLLMNGPNASFDNGNGKPVYHGCDPDNPAVCVPSIGVFDQAGLDNVNGEDFDQSPHFPQGNPNPPPAFVGEDLPEWQQSPSAMDEMIQQWRFFAQQAGAIKAPGSTLATGSYGDFAAGTGLTFCDGNCTLNGDGGGILIVKGQLTTQGGISFRGMIVVLGEEGVLRNGNGGPDDQIIGSLIIAPYTLDPDAWLQPKFKVNGGGTSLITYSGLDDLFDGGITGASNFVTGVAEK